MTRREESYHADINGTNPSSNSAIGISIHDLIKGTNREAEKNLFFDKFKKVSLVDRFLDKKTELSEFQKNDFAERSDFIGAKYGYKLKKLKSGIEIIFTRKGKLSWQSIIFPIVLDKKVCVADDGKVRVAYTLRNLSDASLSFIFGSEWNFTFHAKDMDELSIKEVSIYDDWSDTAVKFSSKNYFDYWQHAVQTVSQTESEYNLSHQGITAFPHWTVELAPKSVWQTGIELEVFTKKK
jgi:alpha-amylase